MSQVNVDAMGNVTGYDDTIYTPNTDTPQKVATTTVETKMVPPDYSSRIKNLRYPLDGENIHFVRFNINVSEESKLVKQNFISTDGYVDYTEQNRANINKSSEDAIKAGTAAYGAVVGAGAAANALKTAMKGKLSSKGIAAKSAVTTGGLVLGSAAGAAAGYGIGSLMTEQFKVTKKLKRLKSSITLYSPSSLRASYSMDYDITDDLLTSLAQSDTYESLKKSLSSAGSFVNSATKFIETIAATNKTVSMLSKTAVNRKVDVMFKSVGNRTFVFNYVFAPKSKNEAQQVADIIFMFKYFAHPEMLEGYGNFLQLYPAEFDIFYGISDKISDSPNEEYMNQNLNRISSCVITSIDIDYAPNGNFQSLENGEPVITTMSIVFKEIETLHRERIAKGY